MTSVQDRVRELIRMNQAGEISDVETIQKMKSSDIESLLDSSLTESSKRNLPPLAVSGVCGSRGAASGRVCLSVDEVISFYTSARQRGQDHRIILVVEELSNAESSVLEFVQGLFIEKAGIASHVVVAAKAQGIPCVLGVSPKDLSVTRGEYLSFEVHEQCEIYLGEGKVNQPLDEGEIKMVDQLLGLISRVSSQFNVPLEVHVNAASPEDALNGFRWGAHGIGLFRTENKVISSIFWSKFKNLVHLQDVLSLKETLAHFEFMQFNLFSDIFKTLKGRPAYFRLLDIPWNDWGIAENLPITAETVSEGVQNRILEIYKTQIRAFIQAVYLFRSRSNREFKSNAVQGFKTNQCFNQNTSSSSSTDLKVGEVGELGIIVPTGINSGISWKHLGALRKLVEELEGQARAEFHISLELSPKIRFGVMIDSVQGILGIESFSEVADFFSFGTNDLTQDVLKVSRDSRLVKDEGEINPFQVLSQKVRDRLHGAVQKLKTLRPETTLGICGEQGGDISTLIFCSENGLNYVSCSPGRVLATRFALVKSQIIQNS